MPVENKYKNYYAGSNSRQNMTGMETKRARGKCIANALVCQLCWTFLFTGDKILTGKYDTWFHQLLLEL